MEQTGVKSISPIINTLLKSYSQQDVAIAVGFLIKLLGNIEANPLDVKYRKIKVTNKTLASKVFAIKGIEQILINMGFSLQGEFYTFNGQTVTPVNQGLIILRARHVGLTSVRTGEITDAQRERNAELAAIKRA